MAEIKGLAGAFIYSSDANRLADWYQSELGIQLEEHPDGIGYYRVFQTRDLETSVVRENPVFAINHADAEFKPTGASFSIGFRVDDLEAFLARLRDRGVEIDDKRLEWKGGKHAWVRDPDGNRVEFYEEIFFSPE